MAFLESAGVDLSGRSEETLAVMNLDNFVVTDLSVRSAGNHFEQVTVWSNWSRGDVPQLFPGHLLLRDSEMYSVDLYMKFVRGLCRLRPPPVQQIGESS